MQLYTYTTMGTIILATADYRLQAISCYEWWLMR